MPAKSKKQQRVFAIAEHNPSALFPQFRQLTSLPKQTLSEFASTNQASLPYKVKRNFIKGKLIK